MSGNNLKKRSIIFICLLIALFMGFSFSNNTIITKNTAKLANKTYVNLDTSGFTCSKGMSVTLKATASSAITSFSSSNKSAVTIEKSPHVLKCINCMNLQINCLAKGDSTITVKGKDGAKASIKVNVSGSGFEASQTYMNINKDAVSCEKGKTVTITASGSSALSSYSTADKSIATISKSSSVTLKCPNCYSMVIKCLKKGKTTFTIKGKDGAKATGKITVTTKSEVVSDEITLDKKTISCTAGKSVALKATGIVKKFYSSDTKIATIVKNPNQTYKCINCMALQVNCLKAGSVKVTVEAESGKKATATVTVKKASTGQTDDVAFSKTSYVCDMSKSQSFTVEVTTKNTSISKIESSDTRVATVKLGKGTKTSAGYMKYTAKVSCLQDGSVKLTATDNKSKKATVNLTVKNGGNILLPSSITCKVKEVKTINVQATGTGTDYVGLKSYSMSDTSVAKVSKNGAAGLACEGCLMLNISCLKEGKSNLTVQSTTGAKAVTTVTVNSDKIPNQVKFTSSSLKCDIKKGSKTITTYVTAGSDEIKNVVSNNKSVATVSFSKVSAASGSTDKIYAVKITCKSLGTARITATSDKKVDGTTRVTVTDSETAKDDIVKFDKTSYTCEKGKTIKVNVSASISDVNKVVSSDKNIAKVTEVVTSAPSTKYESEYLTNSYYYVSNCASIVQDDSRQILPNCVSIHSNRVTMATISCIKNGTVTLTATSLTGSKATAKLTVKTTLSNSKVKFAKNYSCEPGKTIYGLVTISDAVNTTDKQESIASVTSSNTKVATVALDGDTYYTKSKPTERYQRIKISCVAKGTSTLTATTNLSSKGTGKVTVESGVVHEETQIKFDKSTYNCTVGKTATVNIVVSGSNKLKNAYSNNFMMAYLAYKGDATNGKVTTTQFSMSCLKEGTTTLTAIAKDGSKATAMVVSSKEVKPTPVDKTIKFYANSIICRAGYNVLTKVTTSGGETFKSVTSSNSSIATASLNTNFTFGGTGTYAVLVKCIKNGEATLTVTGASGTKDTATVKVVSGGQITINPTGIKLNKTSLTISERVSEQLQATVTPSNATNKTVKWSSNDTSIVIVDSKGLVTGVKEGTATITAKTVNNYTAKVKVTVKKASEPPIVGKPTVELKPSKISLKVGESTGVLATATSGGINTIPTVTSYTTADKSIATIDKHPTLAVQCINCLYLKVKCVKKGNTTFTVKSSLGASETGNITCTSSTTTTPPDTEPPSGEDQQKKKYTIVYKANGGNGSMESQTCIYGEKCTIKSNKYTRSNYTFNGWTTNSDGKNDGYNWTGWSGTWKYENGKYGVKNNKLVLYARWKKKTTDPTPTTPTSSYDITKDSKFSNYEVKASCSGSTLKYKIYYINSEYFVVIWASNPNKQMNNALAKSNAQGTAAAETILNNEISSRKLQSKCMVAVNASFFEYGTPLGGVVIHSGKAAKDTGKSAAIIGINSKNKLKLYRDMSAKDIIADGVYATAKISSNVSADKGSVVANRTQIYQIDDNNFILYSGSGTVGGGRTKINKYFGFDKDGYNLDGGGSRKLYYKTQNQSSIQKMWGGDRAIPDMLYFAEQ